MARKKQTREDELFAELIKLHGGSQEALLGPEGLLKQLTKRLVEQALQAELNHHLDVEREAGQLAREDSVEPDSEVFEEPTNIRNGSSRKTLHSEQGSITLDIPRDRNASFEPLLVPKHKRRLAGLDEKVLGLYAGGMSEREIARQLQELYGVEISASLISQVTDAVKDDVAAWQSRALDEIYPILYLDAFVLKIRQERRVINKSCYLAIGVGLDGQKQALGFWLAETEGAKFWLGILTELRQPRRPNGSDRALRLDSNRAPLPSLGDSRLGRTRSNPTRARLATRKLTTA